MVILRPLKYHYKIRKENLKTLKLKKYKLFVSFVQLAQFYIRPKITIKVKTWSKISVNKGRLELNCLFYIIDCYCLKWRLPMI